MRIVIAGGGIGGLTTALCCLLRGHDVVVLERASSLSEIGAGIQLPPNAMTVFKALGLDANLKALAFEPERIEGRMGRSGLELFSIPLGAKAEDRWGAPYLHIHRADYIEVLEAALRRRAPQCLRLGVDVCGFTESEQSIRVHVKDGEDVDGDVLIGADGVHSILREHLFGGETPRFTGHVAWRAVIPIEALGHDAPRPTACAWMGAGRHCATYRLRGGALANLVAVVETENWQEESWTSLGSKDEALAQFEGWHPTITRSLEVADKLYKWALLDREPLPRWFKGRLGLIGDAAHPMLPFLAQGAAMAVEDSWALAACLSGEDDVERALSSFQDARHARATLVQQKSRDNADLFHRKSLVSQVFTYGPMWLADKMLPQLIQKRQDYLYGYDVTQVFPV